MDRHVLTFSSFSSSSSGGGGGGGGGSFVKQEAPKRGTCKEPNGACWKCGQVTAKAQLLLHPEPKGDVARARGTPGMASRGLCGFVCFIFD